MESHLTIDEVAQRTGLTAHTLRYYERIGLIAPVARAAGGQRRYAASDLAWIEFLLRLRTTHMPIGKMRTFAHLRGAGDGTVPARRQIKVAHYRALEQSQASHAPSPKGNADDHPQPTLPTRPRKAA